MTLLIIFKKFKKMQILEMPSFTLKNGVSETEFLIAHEKFNQNSW